MLKLDEFLQEIGNTEPEFNVELVVEIPESAKPGSSVGVRGVRHEFNPDKVTIELET